MNRKKLQAIVSPGFGGVLVPMRTGLCVVRVRALFGARAGNS